MRKYEIVFIIKPMEDELTEKVIDRFRKLIVDNGGTIDKEDKWGKRRLAYEIQKEHEGYYMIFNVTSESECADEVDRVMKITDDVLRHMIVRMDEE